MKVRIQNDTGLGHQTKITDVETGKELEHVLRAELNIEPREIVCARLTVYEPILDVIADAEVKHICPYCGTSTQGE